MARGRMISASLGKSRKFARLENDTHRLAYVLMVTHADVEGRLEADPRILNGLVFTLLGWTDEQVETALADLDRVGLILHYRVDGEAYVEIVDFAKHNKVRRDREGESDIPPPDDSGGTPGARRESSGQTPAQVEVQVQVEDQEKINVATEPPTDPMKALATLRKKDAAAFKIVDDQGRQLGWQYRHLNLCAYQVLTRGDAALDALAKTLKGADKRGAGAYRYFEAILENPTPRRTEQSERSYDGDWTGADLLDDGGSLEGSWRN